MERHLTRPTVAEVFVHAAAQIHQAAAGIWPGEPVLLDRHVPSVTGYVHRARIGDRTLYAKTSVLGVSLVTLLRGGCGPWRTVYRRQQEYVQQPDGLLAREASQLRILAGLDGPRVCAVVGMRDGVIFTEAVPGPPLAELLLSHPDQTRELLERPLAELRPLHRPGAARRLDPARVIGERSIAGTFLRKFNGSEGAAYVDQLGTERSEFEVREEVTDLVRHSVQRLNGLRMTLPSAAGTTLAYGDLKPEHVIFPDGPDGRPVLLDPGLLRASAMVDVAKLLSRTVLFLLARRPDPATARLILDGLAVVAQSRARHLPRGEQRAWLRHLLTLWLMDTLSITATYLSAPAALPLPSLGLALIERAVPVCSLVDEMTADLLDPAARGVGDRALARIAEVVA
ncbi:phosphotransferase [Streptomyces sp. TRM72054]|uniref:phosphotransferase n=1 Tax=Streptomyces sp. TRM72054 TaxID=2870562 RepID=UPI001C8BD2FB|nr:phosphotransferase [Streptomyces sp. TRM72054]MBX9395681.1 phosphotransferase [Streptomyces sp. TRM72054]